MKTITSRLFSGANDLGFILALIGAVRPPDQLTDYPSRVDLHELLQSPVVQSRTRLWFDGEELVAFALVDEYNNLLFDCSPVNLEWLGDEIVQWGVDCLKPGGARTLDANCRESDITRIFFLESHGFKRKNEETISMLRDLIQPIPEAQLPAGFVIRSVKGETEASALAELHRAAFGSDYMTTENRLAMMRVPDYDPSLDLVVTAPDGSLAAYCMCSISEEENRATGRREGQTDPVATHPRFQKMGLARALLLKGLHLLKERGMDFAGLGTSSENTAMQKTAESVGFYVTLRKIWFEKEIV
ncbi:MAG: GNAT family N-acetyltransferase [Chloroflexota bacterium]